MHVNYYYSTVLDYALNSLRHWLQVFFGASDMQLDVEDVVYPQEVDTELLGSGAVMAFSIITPMILLAYAIEGRKNVQVRGGCSNNVLSRVTQRFIFFATSKWAQIS
jgi:hypothetical protein